LLNCLWAGGLYSANGKFGILHCELFEVGS
jgi:hypothetical protein